MKSMDQLDVELRGTTALDPETFSALVKQCADEAPRLAVLSFSTYKVVVGVKKGSRTVATFESGMMEPKDPAPSGHILVVVDWTEESLRKLGPVDGVYDILKGYLVGVSGFKEYKSFLDTLVRAIPRRRPYD